MSGPVDDLKMYYVLIDGETEGPFSLNELRIMLKGNRITWETLYAVNGMADWSPLIDMRDQLEEREKKRPEPARPSPGPTPKASPNPGGRQTRKFPVPSLQQLALDEIRSASCYRVLRQLIDFLTGIGYLVAAIVGFSGFATILNPDSLFKGGLLLAIIMVMSAVIIAVLVMAIRQALLLMIDIADTLIYQSSDL